MNNDSRQIAEIKEIGLIGPELNEGERSEPERNAVSAKPAAGQVKPEIPDPQVLEHPERRRSYRKGALAALKDDKRGRKKIKHPLETENERLKKNNAHLERRLSQAEAVIDIQKKLSEILGVPLTGIEIDGAE